MLKTRTFSFPNGGHSVRKLTLALEELKSTKVTLNHKVSWDNSFEVWYEEDTLGVEASTLVPVFRELGTRFICKLEGNTISTEFYTKTGD